MATAATRAPQLSATKRARYAKSIVARYKPHLRLFEGSMRIGMAVDGGLTDQMLERVRLPGDARVFVLSEYDLIEEGRLDITGFDYPKSVRGKKLLLTMAGALLVYSWRYDQRIQSRGKYVGDPHTVQKLPIESSIFVPDSKELGRVFTPEHLLALEERFSVQALARLCEVENNLQIVKGAVQQL